MRRFRDVINLEAVEARWSRSCRVCYRSSFDTPGKEEKAAQERSQWYSALRTYASLREAVIAQNPVKYAEAVRVTQ